MTRRMRLIALHTANLSRNTTASGLTTPKPPIAFPCFADICCSDGLPWWGFSFGHWGPRSLSLRWLRRTSCCYPSVWVLRKPGAPKRNSRPRTL